MSDRHAHITQFLYDQGPAVDRFVEVLRERFQHVTPVIREDGRTVAVAFMSSDTGDAGVEIFELPDAVEALAGILEHDVEIVCAWDGAPWGREPRRVWRVPGSNG